MPKEKQKTFFCLAPSLQGTTAAMIKAASLKQAHWIYTNKVVVPAKRRKQDRFSREHIIKEGGMAGLVYWDGRYYIEQMKVWRKVKGCPIATITMLLNLEVTKGKAQYDKSFQD